MAKRPNNWVTREMDERRLSPEPRPDWPLLDPSLLLFLQALYPPKCYEGTGSLEEHLVYAGKVQLVADMSAVYLGQVNEPTPDDREAELLANHREIEEAARAQSDLRGEA